MSGSETSVNVRQRSARTVCAASSSVGRHPFDDADQHQERDGVNAKTCATSTPVNP